jgi:hypothetical protein
MGSLLHSPFAQTVLGIIGKFANQCQLYWRISPLVKAGHNRQLLLKRYRQLTPHHQKIVLEIMKTLANQQGKT